jgi:hypothetical protein
MAINFSDTALRAGMMAFARPITIIPVVSQPGAEPYRVRAILTSRAVDFPLADGSVFSDQETTFGVRVAEVAACPLTNDQVYVDAADWRNDQIDPGFYRISDSDLDRQGCVVLAIRKID